MVKVFKPTSPYKPQKVIPNTSSTQQITQSSNGQIVNAKDMRSFTAVVHNGTIEKSNTPNPWTQSTTPTITTKDMLINFISFTVFSKNANGTTGAATNPYFDLLLNNISIYRAGLPATCSDSFGLIMQNFFQTPDMFLPAGSSIKVTMGGDATDGNGYSGVFAWNLSGFSV